MGTTAQKLQNILTAKLDIKEAIEEKGVTVGNAPLADYGDKIREIPLIKTTTEQYCIGRWPDYRANAAVADSVEGSRSLALDWYPVLVDMTPIEGETRKRPVGFLRRNNFLRFEDGTFAPTVGITEAQRAECDVALYLNADGTNKYCEAGEFDPTAFYNQYKFGQALYDENGNAVRILRPWETTETKYSIFITRKDTIYLLDHETSPVDGKQLNGIVADEGMFESIKPTHKLVPTGIAADNCTEIDGQLRCFFFNYCTGEVGCEGQPPLWGAEIDGQPAPIAYSGEVFYRDGTYPRVLDNDREGLNGYYDADDGIGVNQPKGAKKARACNYDHVKPYPVAELGWHAWNVFVTCLDVAYGTRNLIDAGRFSSGVSSNNNTGSPTNWTNYGGVRYKLASASSYPNNQHVTWATNSPTGMRAKTTPTATVYSQVPFTQLINRYAPKFQCLEAQMALSFAVEMDVQPNTNFVMYGKTYMYANVTGATALLNQGAHMNARLYRTRTMQITAMANEAGTSTNTYDVQCRLRAPIAEGVNLCGDIYCYAGGGYEVVDDHHSNTSHFAAYIECDQTKWDGINFDNYKEGGFGFMETYEKLPNISNTYVPPTATLGASNYIMLRQGYGTWKLANGTAISAGECAYLGLPAALLGSDNNVCFRYGVRFRGHANNAACSPRLVYSSSFPSTCSATYSASAQILLDVDESIAAG